MTIFTNGISMATIVLSTFSAQSMTSARNEDKAGQAEGRYLCAGATWPQIPAMCLEGGSGRQVRYASAPIDSEIRSNFGSRLNEAFEQGAPGR